MQMLVFSTPREGMDDEYNTWYNDVHIPELLQIEGIRSCSRYRAPQLEGQGATHRYLAVYEIDGDAEAVLEQLRANSAEGRSTLSPAIDPKATQITFWEPL
ncbi:DUF4286 family protein [Nocardia nova]|jgi:hypothetical protein|uniref:DUF4286 family protein n=1 Tax=Nocardia nova TaxID=37330 RepID=UPI0018952E3D|nr:DUF4286 family protein [Nocardia nova]MBF6145994.1 hypothetical protein [Nocardia nova]MDN2501068.1 hypothetical protein [Nocardia nova]